MKLVIQNTSHVWGGNEKWLSIVATGLGARGHVVTVSCADGPVRENLRKLGVRVTRHRPRGAIDFLSALDFALFLRAEKPDALLITSWHSISWSVVAAKLAGVRRVVMRLGIVRAFPRSGPRSRALASGVDALIVNSNEIREAWLTSKPENATDDVHVVLNAIRPLRGERERLREALRTVLSTSSQTLLIGGAGHVAPRKGFDILLRAFAKANIEDSLLVITGDGDHRSELESLAQSLGIAHRVHWLGHRDNAAELTAGLDMFVLSSHNEGMANVMLEAMAGGAPVIAADISGVGTAIGDRGDRENAGWTFPSGDVDSLASRLREVSQQIRDGSSDVDAKVEEAFWRIEHWFSPARMIDECEAILFPK